MKIVSSSGARLERLGFLPGNFYFISHAGLPFKRIKSFLPEIHLISWDSVSSFFSFRRFT